MRKVIKNVKIIDCHHQKASAPSHIIINDTIIEDIVTDEVNDHNATVIDLKNHYLLPGLIDNHVHVAAAKIDLHDDDLPPSLVAVQSADYLKRMLQRGFTTVRDAGGADYGLQMAIERGLIQGPRIFPSIRAISQTAGHGDFNHRHVELDACRCHQSGSKMSVLADGVSEARKAVRQQLRAGATQIKIMASGGVASPNDELDNVQFSNDELKAIVEEANNACTYVMAHAYTPRAIQRCIKNGIRSIEHGNLIDEATAKLMQEAGTYLVPTMVTYLAASTIGKEEGFPEVALKKLGRILESSAKSVAIARAHNVKIGFGSDLLGPKAHLLQNEEFRLRTQSGETAHQIICSATAVNAEILQQEGKLGVIQAGATADMIALEKNPLDDITVLCGQGESLSFIMKAGQLIKHNHS